ncbi:hypothetical protein BTJ39_20920 [Izhakiella australiensis]|uniref:Type 1 fimbrial protein n=2 Tax=Izhakiella australiensis TaxID=1926881 RepID=A0A1S8YD90_9GAMM|nr:hypothetical protein BTJ39_20920 [Izhakiella australiensis]
MLFCSLNLLASNVVLADSREIGQGVIHFTGSIVESVCEFSNTDSHISSRCMRDGKMVVRSTTVAAANKTIPAEIGKVETTWLNPEHNLGVMVVSYN